MEGNGGTPAGHPLPAVPQGCLTLPLTPEARDDFVAKVERSWLSLYTALPTEMLHLTSGGP